VRCLYLGPEGQTGVVVDPGLEPTTERHKRQLSVQAFEFKGDPLAVLRGDPTLQGLVIEPPVGWPSQSALRLAGATLRMGRSAFLYWPKETAVERLDAERIRSYWRHWFFITAMFAFWRIAAGLSLVLYKIARRLPQPPAHLMPAIYAPAPTADLATTDRRPHNLDALIAEARPVPFAPPPATADRRIPGCGVYLRTDFWARIESGGSYGHTCYVAKELAAVTEQFVCFMAHPYKLLDDYGLRQVVLTPPGGADTEETIVNATSHYHVALRAAFEAIRPAYIYERLCLGNYVGALLSRQMEIPYIVEYNGSEISMRRSFDGVGYIHEKEYLQAEALAFKQATMISVVSAEVKAGLVSRGVSADKILVNPNGADLAAYAPAAADEKKAVRASAGLNPDQPVVGFTGTFGGWHGIDVLAAALPKICARVPAAQFLMIGDGNYKHLVDRAVEEHGLQSRVRSVGRVAQVEGARLLKACDLYVSPHNSHMVDSKFFGSPTKIFEYMAMGGGIVASDLEQIGQILSPALRVADLQRPDVTAGDARAVLCRPGDIDEFVEAVALLLERPALWPALGRNSRRAVEDHYSWARHVGRLWPFLAGERAQSLPDLQAAAAPSSPAPVPAPVAAGKPQIATGDSYKDEVQKQWNNDAAGSHYVKDASPNTLEWFKEVEAYRYGQYAPWMHDVMEFAHQSGKELLELGGGIGTDLSQFAANGARTTDLDLSAGHLALAKENFKLRGLPGTFIHHDAETLPFPDNTFDVVYSNGVIHHTPNTRGVVREIYRVLKPGGRAIIMVYAENSLHYWRNLVWHIGIKDGVLRTHSMGEIMSRSVERSDNAAARPLVKVYTPARLRHMFKDFEGISIVQRQMVSDEKPRLLTPVPLTTLEKVMGWNLIIKARKPVN
jgi:glycosyltransferase involved in cell wall biosynthesis/ubiquinone/menaquinone biosynthesis C-methylase UbiE